jgi:thiamine pyrophosphate-dependent acetolactate synthase large subunit-like protein
MLPAEVLDLLRQWWKAPYSEFLPSKGAVVQVDERARVIGRRAPTELGIVGSVRPTVKSLLDKAKPKSDSRFFETVTAQRKKWDEMLDKQSDPRRSKDRIHPQAVARAVRHCAHPAALINVMLPAEVLDLLRQWWKARPTEEDELRPFDFDAGRRDLAGFPLALE